VSWYATGLIIFKVYGIKKEKIIRVY